MQWHFIFLVWEQSRPSIVVDYSFGLNNSKRIKWQKNAFGSMTLFVCLQCLDVPVNVEEEDPVLPAPFIWISHPMLVKTRPCKMYEILTIKNKYFIRFQWLFCNLGPSAMLVVVWKLSDLPLTCYFPKEAHVLVWMDVWMSTAFARTADH